MSCCVFINTSIAWTVDKLKITYEAVTILEETEKLKWALIQESIYGRPKKGLQLNIDSDAHRVEIFIYEQLRHADL